MLESAVDYQKITVAREYNKYYHIKLITRLFNILLVCDLGTHNQT